MTKEEIDYIIAYFIHLMSEAESTALKHHFYINEVNGNDLRRRWYLERKMITENPDVLKLLDNGYEQLRISAAENVIKNNPDLVLFNRCKICGKPARTPYAKQCRFCGYDWH